MTRKNKVDDLLTRFERNQKKCSYCAFDSETHMGPIS